MLMRVAIIQTHDQHMILLDVPEYTAEKLITDYRTMVDPIMINYDGSCHLLNRRHIISIEVQGFDES